MSELPPNVRLQLLNTPENVVLVRGMLSGLAEALRLGDSDLNDIRTAVTEACNNVVLHAYGGDQGPMEVEVQVAGGSVGVLVRDRGSGLESRLREPDERGDAEEELSSTGIGLHVIETLAHEVDFGRPAGGGTEVQMRFGLPLDAPPTPRLEPQTVEGLLGRPTPSPLSSADRLAAATVSIAPLTLARAVLPRLVSALASRAHFSTDRISDAQMLADALAVHSAEALHGDRLNVEINARQREIELQIAPLVDGSAQRLLQDSSLDGLGSIIEKLTDSRRVATLGSYETLILGLLDSR